MGTGWTGREALCPAVSCPCPWPSAPTGRTALSPVPELWNSLDGVFRLLEYRQKLNRTNNAYKENKNRKKETQQPCFAIQGNPAQA